MDEHGTTNILRSRRPFNVMNDGIHLYMYIYIYIFVQYLQVPLSSRSGTRSLLYLRKHIQHEGRGDRLLSNHGPDPSHQSRSFRPQLYPMPLLDLLSQHLVHQPMLFDHSQALELCRCYRYRVHAAATTADVFDLFARIMSVFMLIMIQSSYHGPPRQG